MSVPLYTNKRIREFVLIDMEEETMQKILNQGPEANTTDPVSGSGDRITQAPHAENGTICDGRQPDDGHSIPCGFAERLQEVTEERGRLAALVVAWPMDLFQVELLGEVAVPELREQGLVKIQELVRLEILRIIRLDRQIFLPRHPGGFVGEASLSLVGVSLGGLLARRIEGQETDVVVHQDLVGGLRVLMGNFVLHDIRHVLARVVQDQVSTTWMVLHKLGDIVDITADGNVARFGAVMRLDLGGRKRGQDPARHFLCLRYLQTQDEMTDLYAT